MKISTISFARFILAITAMLLWAGTSMAVRVDQYPVTPIPSNFSSIVSSGGTVMPNGNIGYQSYYTNWDGGTAISLPFNFVFDDQTYTAGSQVYAHMGSINFEYWNTTGNYCYYYPIIDMSTISGWPSSYCSGAIAVFSGLQAGNSSYTSAVYSQTTGSAPGRVLTFEWYQVGNYYATELGTCSYQIKLYETSNVIDLIYEKTNFNMTNSSYTPTYFKTVGLNGSIASGTFKQLVIKNTDGTNKFYSTPSTSYRLGQPPINVQLTSSPKTIDMGSVILGFNVSGTATVSNAGDNKNGISMLSIKNVTLTGDPDFTLVSYPASSDSLSVGATRNIVVKFTPTLDGLRSAALTIVSSGKDSGTQVIGLKGIGLAALISVDTNVLFKNKFTKMGTSSIGRVLVTSTGVPDLKITGFNFKGIDASEYSILKAPSVISGGKTDTLLIAYTPTKEGRHSASVEIINNSLNNPVLPITLWGTGTLPHIIVTPTVLTFDSITIGAEVCKNIRIFNPGTDTLLIKSNTMVSNDGDFKYTGLTGADSIIPPDKFKEVTVCFKPISKGSRVARLRFTTNIIKTFEQPSRDTAGQFLIDIRGNGVPFGQLSQKIGNIEGGGWNDESIIGKEICTNDTIWNNGGADILVSSMKLTGSSAANYRVSGMTLPFIIKANSYAVVTICCTPTTQGPNTASLTISGSSSEKPISSAASLSIKGLMVCATATPNPLFDGQLVLENTDSAICVDVTNCGDVPTNYTASLPAGTDYTINGTNPSGIIAPGAKATFCIHFNPKTMGAANTTLTITPSTSELAPLAIPVGGIGACANITAPAVTATTIGKGGHRPFSITITNNGNYTWTPGTATITPNDGIFMLDNNTVPTVGANGNQTITGTFNPDDINKTYSATLSFDGSAPACAAAVSVPLTGQSDAAGVATKTEEAGFSLGQNYPNPFGSVTTFNFTTPTEAQIVLSISDLTGRQIKTITSGSVSSGDHTVQFDASTLASGSYIITLESNNIRLARQIIVAR